MSDTAFHFSDGSSAKTVEELITILRTKEPEVTSRHITQDRNDYAQWIAHVHHNQYLAEKVRRCTTPTDVARVLDESVHPPKQEITPLKEKLRAIAPKPQRAQPVQHKSPPPVLHEEPKEIHQAPPPWTPNTPPPQHQTVRLKDNPHVRDFVLGLVIGFVIGVIAYGLLLQVM